jgi:Mannosyltransferase (PIG-V)
MPATKAIRGTSAWLFVLAIFVLSRLLFLGVGAIAATMLPWAEPGGDVLEPSGFLNYWAHWDGAWYSAIVTDGYDAYAPESTAFFPLFPMLVRAGMALGGGPALWGVLVSVVSTLFALYFLYRISEKLLNARAAKAATLAFAFFPTAFFLNAVYTEALFMALTTGSFCAAYVRRDLLLAGLFGALAAATRNFGVLLLIPLGYEWLRNREEFGWRGALGMGLVPMGLVGYMAFLWYRFGDPLISFGQQSAHWNRVLANPLVTLEKAWVYAGGGLGHFLDPVSLFLDQSPVPPLEASNTVNFAFLILLFVLLGAGFVLLPPGLSVYTFLVTLLPVLTPSPLFPLMSLPRFMLGAFPLFIVLGYLLSRNRPALYLWLIISGGLGVALAAMFVTWRWVA